MILLTADVLSPLCSPGGSISLGGCLCCPGADFPVIIIIMSECVSATAKSFPSSCGNSVLAVILFFCFKINTRQVIMTLIDRKSTKMKRLVASKSYVMSIV